MKFSGMGIMARIIIIVVTFSLIIPMNAVQSYAAESVKATAKIKHKPLKYFVSGKRIRIEAEVKDNEGIQLVRCYFKADAQADYVFVEMNANENDKETFKGMLPAPSKDTKKISYLFLSVNGKNRVVKTQVFEVEKEDKKSAPEWQDVSSEGQLKVSTELTQAPSKLAGFSDSIIMDVVESAARFGVVAGLYSGTQAAVGGTSGAAATAKSVGTISASTGGVSGMAILGIAAGLAAVGGGAAALSGGGSGGDGGDGGGGGGTVTYYENVIGNGTAGYDCTIVFNINSAPRNASVNITSSWGRSTSTTTDSSGSASAILSTVHHNPCLEGTVYVSVRGSQIYSVYDSCW